jgi:NADH dehydrogenase
MARILVTGASGFIGSALTPHLIAATHTPRLMYRQPPATAPVGAEVVRGDLADPSTLGPAVAGCDAVVHLGAATSAGGMDEASARRINVDGAAALIAACRDAGCGRIVVMSTQHVHLPNPGLYGETKREADHLFADSGLDVRTLRPSLVYGPGTRGVFVKLAGLVRSLPIVPIIGPGDWHLRPLYLPDLCGLITACVERDDLAGGTWDAGGPDRVTYTDFVGAICRAQGKPFRKVHLPIRVSHAIASVLERVMANPPLTRENVRGAQLEARCDLTAMCRDFNPRLTGLDEGLRKTVAAMPG